MLTATDGVSVLRLAREALPNLMVLDLMLPKLSGMDVCRVVQAEAPTVILVLTARDSEVDRVGRLEVGADHYMQKPFSMRELMTRVYTLLRRDRISREEGARSAAPT